MDTPKLYFKKTHDKRVKSGHPWVFNNELEKVFKLEQGSIVDVYDSQKKFIGRGYYNSHSLISIRILTRNPEEEINSEFFRRRILEAINYRKQIYPKDSSYRLIYSEGDSLPGLIVDQYQDHLVIQILTAGIESQKKTICELLQGLCHPTCIYERSDVSSRTLENLQPINQVIYGTPNENLVMEQDSIQFYVDIAKGQKTGFFFDHRENRRSLNTLVKDKKVLDLFCGSGSWSLYAANFGAKEVLGIDSSQAAVNLANRNSKLNRMDSICSFVQEDVFEALERLAKEKVYFDVIICDPPAFAKSRQHLITAIKGYQKLNLWALRLLKQDGILVTSSCSYHIDKETFRQILEYCSVKSARPIQLLRYGIQGLDHPILLNVPETEYLKCLTLRVK